MLRNWENVHSCISVTVARRSIHHESKTKRSEIDKVKFCPIFELIGKLRRFPRLSIDRRPRLGPIERSNGHPPTALIESLSSPTARHFVRGSRGSKGPPTPRPMHGWTCPPGQAIQLNCGRHALTFRCITQLHNPFIDHNSLFLFEASRSLLSLLYSQVGDKTRHDAARHVLWLGYVSGALPVSLSHAIDRSSGLYGGADRRPM